MSSLSTSNPDSPGPLRSYRQDELSVRIFATAADLAEDVAYQARTILAEAIRARGAATMILAAANSQIAALGALVKQGGVEWERVTLFHMDEYLGIPAEHPASFRRFLRERVAEPLSPRAFHYLEGDCAQPLDECARYAGLLGAQTIDLCLLGIGENGHLAFNDPPVANFADPHRVKLVRLDEACRQQQVGEGHFPNLAAVPQYAFTLTIPALCAARQMLCIVPERRKAMAVRNTLEGPIQTSCPASFLREQPHCTVFLDLDSASLLTGEPP
jgi:glucosamine-6-phosphate deaminase